MVPIGPKSKGQGWGARTILEFLVALEEQFGEHPWTISVLLALGSNY